MPALWRIGERVGPGTVVEDEFTILSDGRTIERMVASFGQQVVLHGREPKSYFTSKRFPLASTAPMRVVVPFTSRHELTEAGAPAAAEWVDVSNGPFDYWNMLRDYWLPDRDLMLIEHDVQARPDVVESFQDCPEPWCVFPYHDHDRSDSEAWRNALGCTRFRKELISAVPTAVSSVEDRWRDWHYTCDGLGKNLRDAGFTHHWHGPAVFHHHMGR